MAVRKTTTYWHFVHVLALRARITYNLRLSRLEGPWDSGSRIDRGGGVSVWYTDEVWIVKEKEGGALNVGE